MKCNLSPADKDFLLTPQKIKAFFILQYKDQDGWVIPTMESYFTERTWRLFNASKEEGTGTKFCNICRYALASDFGIVFLTPLNFNVFQEIGLMQGLQKQLLYILNPERLEPKKLPFDIDDKIYIEQTNKSSLVDGLNKKIPLIIEKIQLLSGFESEKRKYVKEKLAKLDDAAKGILKILIFEGPRKFVQMGASRGEMHSFITQHLKILSAEKSMQELFNSHFILQETKEGFSGSPEFYWYLNESYRKQLEELLWEDF